MVYEEKNLRDVRQLNKTRTIQITNRNCKLTHSTTCMRHIRVGCTFKCTQLNLSFNNKCRGPCQKDV